MRRQSNDWLRCWPSAASSAPRRLPHRMHPDCWKTRCCSVFLAAASPGSQPTSKLDKHLVEIVASDAALGHRYQLLTSMPGVGPVLACTLIALLPELGSMSRLIGHAGNVGARTGE